MKKNKPVKIKRYRRSFSGSGDRNNLLRRILLWVVILAVVSVANMQKLEG